MTKTKQLSLENYRRLLAFRHSGKSAPAQETVGEFLGRWLEVVSPTLSPTTSKGYRGVLSCVERFALELWSLPLIELTPRHLETFYAERRKAGNKANTIMNIHSVFKASLGWAVRGKELAVSPATELGRKAPTKGRPRDRFPTTAEVKHLVAAAQRDPNLRRFVLLSALMGCRRGETTALRWCDESGGTVRIRYSAYENQGQVYLKETKTFRGERQVPLGEYGMQLWEEQREWAAARAKRHGVELDPNGFVFASWFKDPKGTVARKPAYYTRGFVRLRKRSNIADLHLHDLRHYTATTLIAAGIDIRTVAARLGDDPTVVLRVYANVVPERALAAAEVLGRLLGSDNAEGLPTG